MGRRLIRKVNEYFFPLEEDEQLTIRDGLWFYGTIVITVGTIAAT